MWEIYSIGDSAFLERVLNALAMIAGTGSLEQVAAIGMVVGLILMAFQSVLNGGTGIKFQNLLVSWIIFGCLFGPSARVTIEDVYSQNVRVVDNVPFGVAAAGSMVSKLGYGITTTFEQAFGAAQMMDTGFAFALESLADLRKMSLNKDALGSANSPTGSNSDIWKSWSNYIKDCTLVGVDLGLYSVDDIKKKTRSPGSDIVSQLRFDSYAYGTELYLGGSGPSQLDCTSAYQQLEDVTNHQFKEALYQRASLALGINNLSEKTSRQIVDDTFDALNQGYINAQEYMLTTAIAPIFEWSMVGNELNFHRTASASMLHTAIQQRNESWAAEQALFNTVVRPMMTFFEGLVYAITPMMAFLIGLGPMGFSLIGKYLMILLWVQLWMPVLSIINLYIHMSLSSRMDALQAANIGDTPVASFYGVHAMDQTLQMWISTGAMLASSVPAITLMLVYGSAVTATSVAGRISQGNVPIDNSTPAMGTNSPLMERASLVSASEMRGRNATGADTLNLATKGGYTEAVSSAREESAQQMTNFSNSLADVTGTGSGYTSQAGQSISTAMSETSQDSEGFEAAYAFGQSMLQGVSGTNSLSKQDIATLGTKVLASGGFNSSNLLKQLGGSFGINGSMGSDIASSVGLNDQQVQQFQDNATSNLQSSESKAIRFQQALAKETANNTGDTFTKNLTHGDNTELRQAASEAYSSSQRYSEMSQWSRAMDINSQQTDQTIPGQVRRHGADEPGYSSSLEDDVNQYWNDFHDQGGLGELGQSYLSKIQAQNPHGDAEDQQLAAKVFAIADGRGISQASEGVRQDMALRGSEILSRLSGTGNTPSPGDASRFEGVGAPARQAEGTQELVQAKATGAGVSGDSIDEQVDSQQSAIRENVDSVDPSADYQNNRQEVSDKRDNFEDRHQQRTGAARADNARGVIEDNERMRQQLGVQDKLGSAFSASNLAQGGLSSALTGDTMFEKAMAGTTIAPGNNRDDFINKSPEEQRDEVLNVRDRLKQSLMHQFPNMPEDAATLVATDYTPEAMQYSYSTSENERTRAEEARQDYHEMSGWEKFTHTFSGGEATTPVQGPTPSDLDNAVNGVYWGILSDTSSQVRDNVAESAGGDDTLAGSVISDIYASGQALMNSPSLENGNKISTMMSNVLGAAGGNDAPISFEGYGDDASRAQSQDPLPTSYPQAPSSSAGSTEQPFAQDGPSYPEPADTGNAWDTGSRPQSRSEGDNLQAQEEYLNESGHDAEEEGNGGESGNPVIR